MCDVLCDPLRARRNNGSSRRLAGTLGSRREYHKFINQQTVCLLISPPVIHQALVRSFAHSRVWILRHPNTSRVVGLNFWVRFSFWVQLGVVKLVGALLEPPTTTCKDRDRDCRLTVYISPLRPLEQAQVAAEARMVLVRNKIWNWGVLRVL